MKRYWIFIVLALIVAGIIAFVLFNTNLTSNNDNNPIKYQSESGKRTLANINEDIAENRIASIIENSNEIMQNIETQKQTEISSFATDILDDTPSRLNNISITCDAINNTIVEAGQIFSFNETVGEPTAERGYQEAKIIVDHEAELGIGGGNCQVSSTLYDAVMAAPNLTVIERHEHGNEVGYVPLGQDATVSYGSLDLKFRNDTGHDIKIEATSDNETVTITLYQLGR